MAQIELFETERREATTYTTSLLKSALQKGVRLGRPDAVASVAKSLLLADQRAFTRRLPIVLIEDVILSPGFERLIQCMNAAARSKAPFETEDAEWLMRSAIAAAILPIRDLPARINPERGAPVGPLTRLGPGEARLVQALLRRASVGGMRGDLEMLKTFAGIWYSRFVTGAWDIDRLADVWAEATAKAQHYCFAAVPIAGPDSIPPAAVDHHATGVVEWLMAKPDVLGLVSETFPGRSVAAILKTAIWRERAGLSTKVMVGAGRVLSWPTDFPLRWGAGTDEKLRVIAASIERHLNDYAEMVIRGVRPVD